MRTILLPTGAEVGELQNVIASLEDECVCLIDDLTRVEREHTKGEFGVEYDACDPHVAIITGPVSTVLGKRLGFELVPSLVESRTYCRRPLRMPADLQGKRYIEIDVPNEGWIILRRSMLATLGGLKRDLAIWPALMDYALRVREAKLLCVSDVTVTLYRAAGYSETCLLDEKLFSALRSTDEWSEILRTKQKNSKENPVDIILTRHSDTAMMLLETAGYPIGRIIEGTPVNILIESLLERRNRTIAIVDMSLDLLPKNWLYRLVQESNERIDVGIALLGSDGVAGRIHGADALATLFRPERIPVSRIPRQAETLDAFLASLCAQLPGAGVGIRQTADVIPRNHRIDEVQYQNTLPATRHPRKHISIITISLGLGDVNELTLSRLRANTRAPYDLAVIIHRSHQELIKRVRTDTSIHVYVTTSEASRAEQVSLALSRAQGEYIAILRDDVIIPDEWIDPLEQAMHRIPHAGIIAPRVSNGGGPQIAENERFANTAEFHLTAKRRRIELARTTTVVSFLSQPIFLIRREVIERIGGFDQALSLSELGIIDFCIRVQAAGYSIIVAEDAILHRIHPDLLQSRGQANEHEQDKGKIFAKKWQLNRDGISKLDIAKIANSEIAKAKQYVPFPKQDMSLPPGELAVGRAVFLLPLAGEASWQQAAKLIKSYQKAFNVDDAISLAIGCDECPDVTTVARRVERIVRELNIDLEQCADVLIADARNREHWLRELPSGLRLLLLEDEQLLDYPRVRDLTPSGMRHSINVALQGVV